MPKDKQDVPAWVVEKHGHKYRVIETATGWVWRTLGTPSAAMAWIKAVTTYEEARASRRS